MLIIAKNISFIFYFLACEISASDFIFVDSNIEISLNFSFMKSCKSTTSKATKQEDLKSYPIISKVCSNFL